MENFEDFSRSELLAELKKSLRIIADYKMKLADKALDKTELEAYFSGILDTLPDMVFIVDKQGGTFLDYKTGNPNQLLLPPDQFIGHKISEIFPSEYAKEFMAALTEAIGNCKELSIQYKLDFHGDYRTYDAAFSPFESGKAIVVARDITDRKNIEIKFQESQNKYQELLDLAPDMFFQGDENGNILECNQKAISTLGYERNELIGSHISRFF